MALLKTIHVEQLSVVGTTQLETLGALRFSEDGLKAYRYCKSGAGILQGECIFQKALGTLYHIIRDLSADCPLVAGIALYSIPAASYGWVQVAGYMPTIRDDAAVGLKGALTGHATTDGEASDDDVTNKEHLVFGFALSASTTFVDDNDTTLDCCAGYLHNCLYKP